MANSKERQRSRTPDIHVIFFAFGANGGRKMEGIEAENGWRGWGTHAEEPCEGPVKIGRGSVKRMGKAAAPKVGDCIAI